MKRLTDIPNLENYSLKEEPGRFVINDIVLYVPPTAISIHKEGLEYSFKSLRSKVSTKIATGNGVYHSQIKLTFPQEGILQLHRLICQIRNNPFVTIENEFISNSLNKSFYLAKDSLVNFVITGMQISNHQSSPNAFVCELDARLFNPIPYTRNFGFKEDYLSEVVDGDKIRFFSHRVFPGQDGLFKEKPILNYEIKNNSNVNNTSRRISNTVLYNNRNMSSTTYKAKATQSNAYKRYFNYIQVKQITECFNIIFSNQENPGEGAVYLPPKLKSAFEAVTSENKNIYGLHEINVTNDPSLRMSLIKFRNELIEEMLRKAQLLTYSYKEFKKVVGNKDFIRRYERSLNSGTKGKPFQERTEIRKSNFKQIMSFLNGKVVEAVESTKLEIKDYTKREINSVRALYKDTKNFLYYPPTADASFKEDSSGKLSITFNADVKIKPVFAISDGEVVWDDSNAGEVVLRPAKFGSPPVCFYYNILIPEKIKQIFLKNASVKKGDIIGFAEEGFYIETYNPLVAKSIATNKSNITIGSPKREPAKVNSDGGIFELKPEDLQKILEINQKLISKGYQHNFSRSSSVGIVEKVVQREIDFFEPQLQGLPFEKPTSITGMSCSLRNVVSSIPIMGLDYPTFQYLGSIEPVYHLSLVGRSFSGGLPERLQELENVRNQTILNSKRFNFIPDSHNINIDCFLTRLVGSYKENYSLNMSETESDIMLIEKPSFSINSIDTFTIEGSPGSTGMNFRFSESKNYSEENIGTVRTTEDPVDISKKALNILKNSALSNNKLNSAVGIKNFNALNTKASKYQYMSWKTKYFNAKGWYAKRSRYVDLKNVKPKLDLNAYYFCLEFLDPLQEAVWNAYNNGEKGKFNLQFRGAGTADTSRGRTLNSNHFAYVAADLFVEGLHAKKLAALIVYLAKNDYFKSPNLRNQAVCNLNSTGLGIYGRKAYGSNATDYPNGQEMGVGKKSAGFVHFDANFLINESNKDAPEIAQPKLSRRYWVGKDDKSKFLPNVENRKEAAKQWWGGDVYAVIDHEIENLKKALEAENVGLEVIRDEDFDENDQSETIISEETKSNSKDSNTQFDKTNLYNKADLIAKLRELGFKNDFGTDLSTKDIKIVSSFNDLTSEQKGFAENNPEYRYIVIEGDDLSDSSNKLPKLIEYLNDTHYLSLPQEKIKKGIKENILVIPIPKNYRREKEIVKQENIEEYNAKIEMLSSFRELANIVLTEPHYYLDDVNEIEAEIKRINDSLHNIGVIPNLYGRLNEEVFGVKDAQGKLREILQGINSEEVKRLLVNYSAVGVGATVGTLALKKYLKKKAASFTQDQVTDSIKKKLFSFLGSRLTVVGWVITGASLYFDYNELNEALKERAANLRRARYCVEDYLGKKALFIGPLKIYLEAVSKNSLLTANKSNNEKFIITDNIVEAFEGFNDAKKVSESIEKYKGLVFTNKEVFKKFDRLSRDLKTDSQVKNILNFSKESLKENSKLNRGQKIVGSILSDEISAYLNFLTSFPFYDDKMSPDDVDFHEVFKSFGYGVQTNIKEAEKKNILHGYELVRDDEQPVYLNGKTLDQNKDVAIHYQTNRDASIFKNPLEKYFSESKAILKEIQNRKLAFLQSLLESLVKDIAASSDEVAFQNNTFKQLSALEIINDYTYPDIEPVINPRDLINKSYLSPGFYYYNTEEFKEDTVKTLKETPTISSNIDKIISSSLQFQKDLESGVFAGNMAQGIEVGNFNNDLSETNLIKLNTLENNILREETDKKGSGITLNEKINNLINIVSNPLEKINIPEVDLDKVFGSKYNEAASTIVSNEENLKQLSGEAYSNFFEANSMKKAFPTFRLYIVEEDAAVSDKLLVFDDFYSYNSVISFSYEESRDSASSVARIQLQNISGTLDGSRENVLRDIDIDPNIREEENEGLVRQIQSVVLRQGVNIQLRAGYESNAKELEVLLSGQITDINYSSDNTICNIIVQSYGIELERVIKGSEARGKDGDKVYKTTSEVLASIVLSEELKHFGRVKKGRIFPYDQTRDQIWLDVSENKADESYFYNLFTEAVSFSYGKSFAIGATVGVIATVVPIGRLFFGKAVGGAVSKFSQTALGQATSAWYRTAVSKLAQKNTGIVAGGIRLTGQLFQQAYKFPTGIVGGVLNKRFNISSGLGLFSNIFFKNQVSREAAISVAKAQVQAFANTASTYQVNRLLGRGVVGSLFTKFFGQKTGQAALTKALKNASPKSVEAFYRGIISRSAGHETAMRLLGETVFLTTNRVFRGARIGSFINYGNVLGKAAGFTSVSILGSLIYAGGGAGLLNIMDYFSGYRNSLYKMRKKLLLSPADDNLFPPDPSSYWDEKGSYRSLFGATVDSSLSLYRSFAGGAYSFFGGDGNQKNLAASYVDLMNNYKLFSSKMIRGNEIEFEVNNQTAWQILYELTLRHPGYVYSARPYGSNLEYRLFFGTPNQRHYIKPLTNREAERYNEIKDYMDGGIDAFESSEFFKKIYPEEWSLYENTTKGGGILESFKNKAGKLIFFDQLVKKEYLKNLKSRFVPFRKYHYVDSTRNLIMNDISCTSHNCINTVTVHFEYEGEGKQESSNIQSGAPSQYSTILKASKNIPKELERPKVISGKNINGIACANRYGLGTLIHSMKSMYEGSLLVLGDPKIRPYDVIILNDKITNMYGPLEVKSVSHMFGHDTGFLTNIEVSALISANDEDGDTIFEQSIIYESMKEIYDKFDSRNAFGFQVPGTPDNDKANKALLKKKVKKIIDTKLRDMSRSELSYNNQYHLGSATLATALERADYNFNSASIKEEVYDYFTDRLYEYYKNPESNVFFNDVFESGATQLPPTLKDDFNSLISILGLTTSTAGTGAMGYQLYRGLRRGVFGSFRGSAITTLVGAGITVLASQTDLFSDSAHGLASYFFDKHLKENIVRPQILAKVNTKSLIKIHPLIKDGRPLIGGGLEGVSDAERWSRVLGNIYNTVSDATRGYLEAREEISSQGADIIKSADLNEYSWIKRNIVNLESKVSDTLGLPTDTIVGYIHGGD